MVEKTFKFMACRSLQHTFLSQKIESKLSYLCPTPVKTLPQVLLAVTPKA